MAVRLRWRPLLHAAWLLAGAAWLSPAHASAEPLITSFDEVLASSTDVVIARYRGAVGGNPLTAAHYVLDVERALRGTLRGRVRVTPGDGHASFPVGTRLVAFISHGSFRFVGLPIEGRTLETGPVCVSGFYDFNAHIVTPGMTTLSALHERLAGRAATVRYVGPLLAVSDDGLRRVTTPWTVSVTLVDRQPARGTGLPVVGFGAPSVGQGGLHGEMRVTYRSSWPRPLRIEGRPVGIQGSAVTMEFWVREPTLLRVSDIRRYLTDESVDWVHYELRAVFANGEVWADGPDRFDYSDVTFFGHLGYRSMSFDERDRRVETRTFTMGFDDRTRPVPIPGGDDRELLQELLGGPLGFRITSGVGAGRRGRVELVATHFRSHP